MRFKMIIFKLNPKLLEVHNHLIIIPLPRFFIFTFHVVTVEANRRRRVDIQLKKFVHALLPKHSGIGNQKSWQTFANRLKIHRAVKFASQVKPKLIAFLSASNRKRTFQQRVPNKPPETTQQVHRFMSHIRGFWQIG